MTAGNKTISATEVLAIARAWRLRPDEPVMCPSCGAAGLVLADQSARPYREWFTASCPSCGFEKTVSVAMAPPSSL